MISKSCFSPSSTALLWVFGGRPVEKGANECSANRRSMNVYAVIERLFDEYLCNISLPQFYVEESRHALPADVRR